MIYFVIFAFSILFMYLAENREEDGREIISKVYLVTSGVILVLLAFFRAESVGHDIGVYQKYVYELALRSSSFSEYLSFSTITDIEPAYAIVTYIASRFRFFPMVFLLNESLVVFFTYLSIWGYREYVSPYLSLACYLFVYYLMSFDAARQSIAIALVMYAIVLYDKNKWLPAIVLSLGAFFFHKSAIIVIILLFFLIKGKKDVINDTGLFSAVSIIIVTIVLVLSFRRIFIWIGSILTFLPRRYFSDNYMYNADNFNFTTTSFIYILIMIVIMSAIINSSLKFEIHNSMFYLYMMLICIGRIGIGSQSTFMYRVFYYPEIFSIFVLPLSLELVSADGRNQTMGKILIIIFLVSFFAITYIVHNTGEVFPYILNKEFL